ncbi:TonB-dependent receptor [Aliarcobacter lanthieri]|uniref:TonB-dependent receptor n=2 Tax=Aliarcobacter lanthieri TaxID=1355374 RepID=UPI0009E0AFEF|nr:TonB-dependent receptor [Aliarcobacter lanthieri]
MLEFYKNEKKMFFKIVFIFLLLPIILFSQELENILDDLNKYSDKSNLNIDYKPTAMTVLYANDLQTLGINTLSEALNFVAGIQAFKTTSVNSIVSVRGYTQPLNSFQEKIKYRINGVSVSSNYFENFPISLIDRIEISKGNASTIYDQGGFVAVIDIITKNKSNIAFGTGSFDNKNFSLLLNEKLNDNWKLKLSTSYLKHNKKVDAPSAILTNSIDFGTNFDRKQESLEGIEDILIGASLENKNFKISSNYIKNNRQNNYGTTGLLDWSDDGYSKYEMFSNEITYDTFLNTNNILEMKIGSVQSNYKMNTYMYKFEPNNVGIYDPHFKVDYTQRESYISLLVKNTSFTNNKIEYGVYGSLIQIPKNKYYTNVDYLTGLGQYIPKYDAYFPIQKELKEFSGKQGFISDESSKTNMSYFLADTYSVNENLTLLANLGIDDYQDYKKLLNFRLGSVYSIDDINIYKFSISQANRNPSLIEDYFVGHIINSQDQALEAEKLQSVELMYIYQQNDEKLKLNLYYQKYINSIDGYRYKDSLQYYNKKQDEYNYGAELEYSKNFENRSKVILNASFNSFAYKNSYENLKIDTPIVSKITTILGYIYPINSKFTISPLIRYYGSKNLLNGNKIGDVALLDLTLTHNISKDAKLYFGAKNILDKEYFYYGYNTKDEKMLREGTTWFVSFSYDF